MNDAQIKVIEIEVMKLDLGPGDILVIRVPDEIEDGPLSRIGAQLNRAFSRVGIITMAVRKSVEVTTIKRQNPVEATEFEKIVN